MFHRSPTTITRSRPRFRPASQSLAGRCPASLIATLLIVAVPILASVTGPGGPEPALAGPAETGADLHALYDVPLLDGQAFDPAIPRPADILGYPVGSRAASPAEIVRVFEALAASSPRAELRDHGTTHEERRLVHLVVSSDETMANLAEVRAGLARLADPRGTNGSTVPDLIHDLPATCWLGYSIHGDELSGSDAAMLVAYRMVAGTDSLTRVLRERLIVIIDPLENPDGRERYIQLSRQWSGERLNPDLQSLQHAGFWPWGRTNHYLFDLNRDWFALVHPESRGRAAAIVGWQPQILVDAHEMGSFDTFLFTPPREPFNPNMTGSLKKWWDVFADDVAEQFDERGWSYYTRAWHEEWFPGYGSSWACYLGAVGILYEQAKVRGSIVKRPDESTLVYPETVHHQYVASIANLATAARNRRELLTDFLREKRRAITAQGAFIILAGDQPTRAARLAAVLVTQGIEVHRTRQEMPAALFPAARDLRGRSPDGLVLPAGSYVVNLNQPMSPLARAILELDPRMPNSFLETELYELRKHGRTRMYEASSWSMLHAYGLEALATQKLVTAPLDPVTPAAAQRMFDGRRGKLENAGARHGYLIDWRQDTAAAALVQLLERGLQVRSARKDFRVDDRDFPRGTLLIPRRGGPEDLDATLEEIAQATGATMIGVNTALSEEGPDLGGGDFRRLREPRIAVVAGHPVSYGALGPLWHLLDKRLEARVSLLDLARLGQYDLTKYNVLVLPHLWGSSDHFSRALGEQGMEGLRVWLQAGGTLIGMGTGADFAVDPDNELSQVRLRRTVLDELDDFDAHLERELLARSTPVIDSLAIWEQPGLVIPAEEGQQGDAAATGGATVAGVTADGAATDVVEAAAIETAATDDAQVDADQPAAGETPAGGEATAAGETPAADEAPAASEAPADTTASAAEAPDLSPEERERLDADQRLLHPRGASLVAELDDEHWLTAGMGAWIPVNVYRSQAYMSRPPVVTPARLAPAASLRIGGLLWPEARERWAHTAYATRESKGRGQIILFADIPSKRGYWYGSERLLINALLLGPGFGTSAPVPW